MKKWYYLLNIAGEKERYLSLKVLCEENGLSKKDYNNIYYSIGKKEETYLKDGIQIERKSYEQFYKSLFKDA